MTKVVMDFRLREIARYFSHLHCHETTAAASYHQRCIVLLINNINVSSALQKYLYKQNQNKNHYESRSHTSYYKKTSQIKRVRRSCGSAFTLDCPHLYYLMMTPERSCAQWRLAVSISCINNGPVTQEILQRRKIMRLLTQSLPSQNL